MMNEIVDIDADECVGIFADGTRMICPYRPHFTFAECAPGYGSHGDCLKWNYYHKKVD